MPEHQLRWGLLGCGFITGDFAEALKLLPPEERKIVALGSQSLERCKEFQRNHDLKDINVYGSYDEFFKDPEIEVVYIGTRNNKHLKNALQALNAKKHVLCEKPLGLNKGEVMKMIEAAKEAGVYFQEAFWSRFFPVYHEIQKVLKDGLIGDVHVIQANLGFDVIGKLERLHRMEHGGGMALDLGGYLCLLSLFVFGKGIPVEKIYCTGWKEGEVDDTACITIKFSGKRMAQLMYSGTLEMAGSAQICGTKGRIEIPMEMNCPEQCKVTIMPPEDSSAQPTVNDIVKPRPKADINKFHFKKSNGLAFEADGVRKHILKGDLESNEIPFDETIKIAEMLDEIRKQMGMPE